MTVQELKDILSKYDKDMEVKVYQSYSYYNEETDYEVFQSSYDTPIVEASLIEGDKFDTLIIYGD